MRSRARSRAPLRGVLRRMLARNERARRIGLLAVTPLAVGVALAGCGLAVGPAPSAVRVLVTTQFGARELYRSGVLHAGERENLLAQLTRERPVATGPHGASVLGIDGLRGGEQKSEAGQASAWFYYVNGVQMTKWANAIDVQPGDHVWWDLHDASQADEPAAIVGAYPEPFLNGYEGKRLPVRVECASASTSACTAVTESLRRAGVPAAVAAIGSGGAPETLRVMVGPWIYLEGDLEAGRIARGPRASGVYVHLPQNGEQMMLLDQQGGTVETLGAGAGLVAATKGEKEAPVWVITGTDNAGVTRAAHALDAAALANHFAVAIAADGTVIALPAASATAR
jgi:hypothetical protein